MQNPLKLISKTSAAIATLLGAIVLTGWLFNITLLKSIIPSFVSMKANTALCFMLSGIALWMLNKRENIFTTKKIIISLCSWFIIITGLLTLIEYFFEINLHIDEFFFKDDISVGTSHAGRMSPVTAFNFCLVGMVLYLSATPSINYKIIQGLTGLIFTTSLFAFCGYVYGEEGFYGISFYTKMALHTSLAFITISLGVITTQGEKGILLLFTSKTLGGTMARRLIPLVIFLPLFLGWLRLQGEYIGLYKTSFGVALFSILTILILMIVVFWNAKQIRLKENNQKKTEDELIKSNERFFNVFDHNPVGMILSNLETARFQYVNKIFVEHFGYSKEEVIGKTSLEFNLIDPIYREKILSKVKQEGKVNDIEILTRKKNGETFWSLTSVQVIIINDKKFALTSFYNITDRKKMEEAIKQKTVELAHTNKELEEFVYAASHDLQEPLRTITNFTGLLKEKHSEKAEADAIQYLGLIEEGASKMRNLINDLLDLSRIGKTLTFTEVDCNNILKEVITELGASINECNAKITSTSLPVLKGDYIKLKRLFQNLISNAIKFRKKNMAPEIKVSVGENDFEYLFTIKDNGIGIEEQYIDRIFIIFQRLQNTDEYPGTGIGLAICKKIVTLHNGKIWVESEPGVGSVFYFSIGKENFN